MHFKISKNVEEEHLKIIHNYRGKPDTMTTEIVKNLKILRNVENLTFIKAETLYILSDEPYKQRDD